MSAVYFSRECSRIVQNADPVLRGHPTHFDKLDEVSGGLRAGELVVVGARPSVGKSAFMADLVLNMSNAMPTLIFSAEMANSVMSRRLIGNMAEISPNRLNLELNDVEQKKLDRTIIKLTNRDIIIDDTSGVKPADIEKALPKFKDIIKKANTAGKYTTGTGMVCVDYLQLMRPDNPGRARHEEIGDIAYQLREFAKKYNVIMVVLAQLNREVENRRNSEPRLADLKDSGVIEQAADLVLLLHRPSASKMQEFGVDIKDDGEAFVIVAKNRQGPTGKMRCVWVPEIMSYRNIGAWANEDVPEVSDDLFNEETNEPSVSNVEETVQNGSNSETLCEDTSEDIGTPFIDTSDCSNDGSLPDLFANDTPALEQANPNPDYDPDYEVPEDSEIPF